MYEKQQVNAVQNMKWTDKHPVALVDSGATVSVTGDARILKNMRPTKSHLRGVFDAQPVTHKGDMEIMSPSGPVLISNVRYCPGLHGTILGVKKEVEQGSIILTLTMLTGTRVLFRNASMVTCAVNRDGLDILPLILQKKESQRKDKSIQGERQEMECKVASVDEEKLRMEQEHDDPTADLRTWHDRLGHRSKRMIKELQGKATGIHLSEPQPLVDPCVVCQLANQKRTPIRKVRRRPLPTLLSTTRRERMDEDPHIVHTDLTGPVKKEQLPHGHRYAVNFVHRNTRYTVIHTLEGKTAKEVSAVFSKYAAWTKYAIKRVVSDGGAEFKGEFKKFCEQYGIQQELTAPSTPEQNSIAESNWRECYAVARALLVKANLPEMFLFYAMRFATFVHNRTLTKGLKDKITPYEAFYGEIPDLSYLRTFGCIGTVLREEKREFKFSKTEQRALSMIYVGPSPNRRSHLMWDPVTQKEITSRHVRFFEGSPGSDILRREPLIGSPSTWSTELGMHLPSPDPKPAFRPASKRRDKGEMEPKSSLKKPNPNPNATTSQKDKKSVSFDPALTPSQSPTGTGGLPKRGRGRPRMDPARKAATSKTTRRGASRTPTPEPASRDDGIRPSP